MLLKRGILEEEIDNPTESEDDAGVDSTKDTNTDDVGGLIEEMIGDMNEPAQDTSRMHYQHWAMTNATILIVVFPFEDCIKHLLLAREDLMQPCNLVVNRAGFPNPDP